MDYIAEHANHISKKDALVAMTMKRQDGARFGHAAWTINMHYALTVNNFLILMIANSLTTSCQKSLHLFFDLIGQHVSSKSERLESNSMQTTWQCKNFNLLRGKGSTPIEDPAIVKGHGFVLIPKGFNTRGR